MSIKYDYSGRTCLVTGAAGAMGFETSLQMAKAGANVIMMDTSLEKLDEKVRKIGDVEGRILTVQVDLSSEESIGRAMQKVFEAFPVVNILVCCAGISSKGPLLDMDMGLYDKEQAINCKSIIVLAQYVCKRMLEHKISDGRIISISSQSGKRGEAEHGSYCISKTGVIMLTQVLGLELADKGITVNAIAPGMVDTPMLRGLFAKGGIEGDAFQKVGENAIPMKRFAKASDIANLIMFLASKEAEYITGVTISDAGGTCML